MSKPDLGRYSRVSRRIWNDDRFLALDRPKPSGSWLFFRLLTGPELTNIPGLFQAWEAGLAQALHWSLKDFRRAFSRIEEQGLARADWHRGLVWVPKAIHHNEPESPNVVVSWRRTVGELPDCDLLHQALTAIGEYLAELGPEWSAAWDLSASKQPRAAKIPSPVRVEVRLRDGDFCRYCAAAVNWSDRRGPTGATYDHINPTGPSDTSNLVVACRSCNSKKGFRTPELAQMTIQVLPESKPRSELGSVPDLNQNPSANQNQEQKQEQREDPPTPKRPNHLPPAEKLFGAPPNTRPDVIRLHERWKRTFGFTNHQLLSLTADAQTLADALDSHGEDACNRVLDWAPNDDKVSGRSDERREKHESIAYIFGNPQTFARLERDSRKQKQDGEVSGVSVVERMRSREAQ